MFHHVEEMLGVDYRYIKNFTGIVTDENGKSYEDTFSIYVLNREQNFFTYVQPIGKILEEKGVMKIDKIGDATIWYMKADDMYRVTADAIKKNPRILCKIVPP
jgi:aminoglycoside 3-N-acetyltransferase